MAERRGEKTVDPGAESGLDDIAASTTVDDLAKLLRQLRRREARERGDSELTYRGLAAKTGWSVAIIGQYLKGEVLPPTDRFDVLIQLLGATPAEQRRLATARDLVEEARRQERSGRASADVPVPRQLPAAVSGFVGRTDELAELDELLLPDAGTVVISAVSGTGGVGKTALAVHWAYRVADRFPDGQLYVDLCGYGPDRPLPVEDALAAFLRSLGVPGEDIPHELGERAARYRTLLAGRRMLVLLDNARSAEQVRPLLPGAPSCRVVVTSRDNLAGLVAREGARRLDLDVLTMTDAVSLLRSLVGGRIDDDVDAAVTLAQRCARLPLALRVAAELAAARPDTALADLADDLRDTRRRLDLLDSGDSRAAVRAVLSWSYQNLSAPAARAFRLLGLYPGGDFDVYALAALTGAGLDEARQLVGELVRAHLVQRSRTDRLEMHDLLRAYAAETAAQNVVPAGARDALTRLLDHYLRTATIAVDALFAFEQHGSSEPPAAPTPPVPTHQDALSWLDSERPNLVAMSTYAAGHGWPEQCGALSRVLFRYLDTYAHYEEALTVHGNALAFADGGEERATVLTHLGIAMFRLGRLLEAIDRLHEGLVHSQMRGDRDSEARIHANLGLVCQRVGRLDAARDHLLLALAYYRENSDVLREAKQLLGLGLLYWRLGRREEAVRHLEQAAVGGRARGDRSLEGLVLANLGDTYATMRRFPEALEQLAQALAISRELNYRRLEGDTLGILGSVYRRLDRDADALEHLEQALAISRETGDRRLEIDTRNSLGETLLSMGRTEAAAVHHGAARDLAGQTGDREEHARALEGLAQVSRRQRHPDRARQELAEALALYTELELPAAERVRAALAALTPPGAADPVLTPPGSADAVSPAGSVSSGVGTSRGR